MPIAGGVYALSNRYAYNKDQSHYYKYSYRSNEYSLIEGSKCTNNQSYDGIIYGQFQCPIEGFDVNEKECCGEEGEQFCCSLAQSSSGSSFWIWIVVLVIFVSILLAVFVNITYNFLKPYFHSYKPAG